MNIADMLFDWFLTGFAVFFGLVAVARCFELIAAAIKGQY